MTQIGTVYAQALYSLAAEEGCTEEVLSALSALETSVEQEPEFLRLLSTPNLSKEERCKIIDDSFSGKMPEILLNFLKLLTEKGYARHLGECVKAYQAEYDRCHNILRVEAVTAVPLSGPQADRLTGKLSTLTGKAVRLHNRVDPACLGGVRLCYDGRQVDDTVSHRLEDITNMLKNTVL